MGSPTKSSFSFSYLPTLDGWRALAILAVIVSHGKYSLFGPAGLWNSPSLLTLSAHGRLGVDLFFAISGFLITGRLLQEEAEHGKFNLRHFYLRRIFRILPPAWLYLSFLAVAGFTGQIVVSAGEIADCFLFVRNYTTPPAGYYTGHFWSLCVEEHFYLLWPLFLTVVPRRRLPWIVAGLCLAVHGWRGLDSRYFYFAGISGAGVGFRTDTRIDALLWGSEAALLWPFLETLRARRALAGSWVGLTALLFCVIRFSLPMSPLFLALIFPSLVVNTVLFPQNPLGRFLEWAPMRWMGRLSYSLYLWHILFMVGAEGGSPFFHLPFLRSWPWNLAATFAVALVSYHFVEQPLIRVGKKLIRGSATPPMPLRQSA